MEIWPDLVREIVTEIRKSVFVRGTKLQFLFDEYAFTRPERQCPICGNIPRDVEVNKQIVEALREAATAGWRKEDITITKRSEDEDTQN